ncbi:hypothetical protein L1887_21253 [Cichorium endivia]|nr:hypothetical protein L1887_21253 [Cichorium endivia]
MTITSFGAIGTLISFAIISYGASILFPKLNIGPLGIKDYLEAIGAIFSATDSVCALQVLNKEETPLLHSLVFGEGVVNDATTVVLFNTITNFDLSAMNATAALKIGTDFVTLHATDREVALMILMAYLSYITAEVFKLSGILTVFFCGIVISHYAWHNVTTNSQVTTKHTFATMSYIAEVFIFLYVGMDSLDVEKWRLIDNPRKSISASAILLGLIMVGRAVFVLFLSCLSNLIRNDEHGQIKIKQQVTIWWAGLMRGAVSVALAYKKFTGYGQTIQPVNAHLITSTISIVLFSTVKEAKWDDGEERFEEVTMTTTKPFGASSPVNVLNFQILVEFLASKQGNI